MNRVVHLVALLGTVACSPKTGSPGPSDLTSLLARTLPGVVLLVRELPNGKLGYGSTKGCTWSTGGECRSDNRVVFAAPLCVPRPF